MKPKIFDDFFDKHLLDYICYSVQHPEYPWSYNSSINKTFGTEPWMFGFARKFIDINDEIKACPEDKLFFPLFLKLHEEFNRPISDIVRARTVMMLRSPPNTLHSPHQDMGGESHLTFILYLNDSDGSTIIYNENEHSENYSIQDVIEPKKNRLLMFDGSYFHAGHSPSQHNNRVLLNINYRGL